MRLVINDDAGIGRNAYLTVCEGIKGIDGNVGRLPRGQLYQYFHVFSRVVHHFFNLDLAFVIGFDDGVNEAAGSGAIRYFTNGHGLSVQLFHLRPHLDFATSQALVVLRKVGLSACEKIGVNLWLFALQYLNGCPD